MMYYVIFFIVAIIAGVAFEVWDINSSRPEFKKERKIIACVFGVCIGFIWPIALGLALIFGTYCLLTSKIVKILTKYHRDYQSFKNYQDKRNN